MQQEEEGVEEASITATRERELLIAVYFCECGQL